MNMSITELIAGKEYEFLRTDERLKGRLVFLTFGGSHAYGTATEGSDVDIRGCAFNRRSDLIGLSGFEQVVDVGVDATVYSFNKLIKLIIDCNPNTIEMLGCKPEHYVMYSPVGQELVDNRKMFMSKRAVYSFGGYANQQLRRLQNALARDTYPQAEKERHILGSIKSAMMFFNDRYESFPEGAVSLKIDKSASEGLESEIFMDASLEHYPLRDYKNMWGDMNNIVKEYDKLNKRNRKKDDLHLNKHAMHLIRLYLMCLDILEKEEVNTYREGDLGLLMHIRGGGFQKEDGAFSMEFFDLVSEYEKRLEYATANTGLPE
ncbi:MAG: nucleotidyltransferase domain-containing protein, partial [Clostridiales bacterium]|nr:nucleotidyltransferase domain-containing protein [Clostridiales bacterium]